MTEKEKNKILIRAINTYGQTSQLNMATEEMAELTKAICKLKRAIGITEYSTAVGNIIEEMADVQIMLDQLKIIFKSDAKALAAVEHIKLHRLEKRLDKFDKMKEADEQ